MAERERAAAPPYGGVFIPRKQVMDADDLQRAIWRIGHEIVERNHGVTDVVLVGLQTGGMPIAHRLAEALQAVTEEAVPVGSLDVVFYRDDLAIRPSAPVVHATHLDFKLDNRTIVIVDDVLYTGRTVRAAIDEVFDYGRPARVQLAVLVDRGPRELPIRPDYVGKNLPTRRNEAVDVREDGVWLGEVTKEVRR